MSMKQFVFRISENFFRVVREGFDVFSWRKCKTMHHKFVCWVKNAYYDIDENGFTRFERRELDGIIRDMKKGKNIKKCNSVEEFIADLHR